MVDEMETREAMKNKGYAVLKKLEDNCLLENAGNGDSVEMHDAVRDMALSIISTNPRYMVKAGMQLKQLPEGEEWTMDAVKISLMENSIGELLLAVKCERLTTLLLGSNPIKRISDSFFLNMPCLRVLDLSSTCIECLPNSIANLKNLTALLLHACTMLRNLPCLSKLQGLKKLDLCYTRLKEAPQGLEFVVNLKYLDLFDLSQGITLPIGLLPKLSRLQFLRLPLRSCVKAEEVAQLEKLEHFEGSFKDLSEFNKHVQLSPPARTLSNYQINVDLPEFVSSYDKVIRIEFGLLGDAILLPTDVQSLLFSGCQNLRSLSEMSSLKYVVDLRSCHLYGCGFEFVLSSFCSSWTSFRTLEKLIINGSPKLCELIKAEGFAPEAPISAPPGIFSHLKKIDMHRCPKIRKLFPHWLLANLQNLEEIVLWYCDQLVEVMEPAIPVDEYDENGIDTIKIILPKLRKLELGFLPELKSICGKTRILVFDSLESIEVHVCGKLKRIPLSLPFLDNGQPYAPPSLKIISSSEKWWESLEWDHPNYKEVLQPHCQFSKYINYSPPFIFV
ncbi:hypothetical protein DITRI_Ditri01bG0155600 [Diplodiscus trichospermus]